jgi:signal transduction histidine kinase/CheY-like chemotaxis protein
MAVSAAPADSLGPRIMSASGGLVAWLPRGNALPEDVWRARHAGLRWVLWAHIPALVGFGALVDRLGHQHGGHPVALLLVPVAVLGAISGWEVVPRRVQAIAVALGLLTAAGVGVHLAGGVTEAHFLFFVLMIVLSLYEDWLIFGIAIGFVVVHHGVAATVGLGAVYHHPGSTWPWAGVHGAFVLAAAASCVVTWRLSEQLRAQLRSAELQTLESNLREAQKLESLGLLAGGVAHDFNNLLVGVLGNAGLALECLPADSAVRPYLEQIELTGQRAADLTKQMLAYSGNSPLGVEEVDLSALVSELAQLLEAGISKQAQLELELDREVGAVLGDTGQLSQVVMNLITNAAESLNGSDGTISVRTRVARDSELEALTFRVDPDVRHLVLEVADTGCGMDKETRRRVFEPFFTTKFTGRGLGLAAVAGVVRSLGGQIDVESRVGVGTTFRVFLPALVCARRPPRRADSSPGAGAGRVLVVDDEPTVLQVAALLLESAGFEPVATSSGSEAVARFRADGPFVAAVIDMTMPGLNGIETTRALRVLDPGLVVLLTSGYSTASFEHDLPPLTRFIQKPYTRGELVESLLEALDGGAAPVPPLCGSRAA